MTQAQCYVGDLSKTAEGIVTITVTCVGEEVSQSQMIEAVNAIDAIAETPSPLLVDISQSHSLSFGALLEMAKSVNTLAVALYAPNEASQMIAEYVSQFQSEFGTAPYPFKIFTNINAAKDWLRNYCVATT